MNRPTLSVHFVVISTLFLICYASKTPTSTLLSLHRPYMRHSPHDSALYDTLGVFSNATHHQIMKAYRKMVRRYHPDKCDGGAEKLEDVRKAYEILGDDQTRLPYHLYGIIDPHVAVALLTGQSSVQLDPSFQDLLAMMGFDYDTERSCLVVPSEPSYFVAADLVERIRPFVEGVVKEQALVDQVAAECHRLKRLPLGAHILRCIGRAYRHTGRSFLQQSQIQDRVRATARQARHIAEAALASSRAAVAELGAREKASDAPRLDHCTTPDNKIRQTERRKARQAMLESLQVEALWKIKKMELDQRVRHACQLILEQNYFFYATSKQREDGWVGSAYTTVDADEACRQTARALVLMGDIMVQVSKLDTSWCKRSII